LINGPGATETLQRIVPRDVLKFKDNRCYYTHLCNEEGGIIDDIIIFRIAAQNYFVVVNAGTKEIDFAWINQHKTEDCFVENVSDKTGKIDVQGPQARAVLNDFLGGEETVNDLSFYQFWMYKWQGFDLIISRTGYTGELGFEIYCPADQTAKIWENILEVGKPYGILPAGLGARDTLRLEMGYPLMGLEMNEETTPIEAGFAALVNKDKDCFVGRESILEKKDAKHRVAFVISKGGIARHDCLVLDGNHKSIGKVTSGTFSPTLKQAIGLALCDVPFQVADPLWFDIRGKIVEGVAVCVPFVKETSLKK